MQKIEIEILKLKMQSTAHFMVLKRDTNKIYNFGNFSEKFWVGKSKDTLVTSTLTLEIVPQASHTFSRS